MRIPPLDLLRPSTFLLAVLATAGTLGIAAPVLAQSGERPRTQVVSANPFAIMIEFFNAQYEHTAGESFTVGVSGSTFKSDGDRYLNIDGFWRFYPQEHPDPLRGFSFGIKAGITSVDDQTAVGAGVDIDHGWLLGREDNFYVGMGFGLKRLMREVNGHRFIPTLRLVNIGMAF